MKTNFSKKEMKAKLENLLEKVQEVGFAVGNPELNYMNDEFRDEYAAFEGKLEELIQKVDKLQNKQFSDLISIEDFIAYYQGASKAELKARLKTLGNNHLPTIQSNERDAINALLV